jgi:hypothetical protein
MSKGLGKVDVFWIHQLPQASSLLVFKQVKQSVEAIKDFDKNSALCMHDN